MHKAYSSWQTSGVLFERYKRIRTHSWRSHEDSGDHNLRDGLLSGVRRLTQPVVVLVGYGNAVLKFSENKQSL